MADTVMKAKYFKVMVANRPGMAAKILSGLHQKGVNLYAFSGFPSEGKAQLDFVPMSPSRFKAAAKKIGLKTGQPKACFIISGSDKPGAVARILGKLAKAGVSVTAMDGVTAGAGRWGAILWVKSAGYNKAAKALGAR